MTRWSKLKLLWGKKNPVTHKCKILCTEISPVQGGFIFLAFLKLDDDQYALSLLWLMGFIFTRLALPLCSSQSQHDPEHTLNVSVRAGKGLHQSPLSSCLPLPTESWVFTTQTEHGEYEANSWVSLERLYYICLFGERRGLMPRGMPRSQRTAWMEHRSRLMC